MEVTTKITEEQRKAVAEVLEEHLTDVALDKAWEKLTDRIGPIMDEAGITYSDLRNIMKTMEGELRPAIRAALDARPEFVEMMAKVAQGKVAQESEDSAAADRVTKALDDRDFYGLKRKPLGEDDRDFFGRKRNRRETE